MATGCWGKAFNISREVCCGAGVLAFAQERNRLYSVGPTPRGSCWHDNIGADCLDARCLSLKGPREATRWSSLRPLLQQPVEQNEYVMIALQVLALRRRGF